jgi:hypothetical protein
MTIVQVTGSDNLLLAALPPVDLDILARKLE